MYLQKDPITFFQQLSTVSCVCSSQNCTWTSVTWFRCILTLNHFCLKLCWNTNKMPLILCWFPASHYLWHSSLFYCYDSFMPVVLLLIKNNKKKFHSKFLISYRRLLTALVMKPPWAVSCLGQLWTSSSSHVLSLIPSHNEVKSQ